MSHKTHDIPFAVNDHSIMIKKIIARDYLWGVTPCGPINVTEALNIILKVGSAVPLDTCVLFFFSRPNL